MSLTPNWPKSPIPSAFDELYEQRPAMTTTSPDWADAIAKAISDLHPNMSEAASRRLEAEIAQALRDRDREAYERGATDMRERAAAWHDEMQRILLTNPDAYDGHAADTHKLSAKTLRALPSSKEPTT